MTTGAKEWGQPYKEGVEIRLPSGNEVRLRPISLDVLLLQGNLPDFLTPIVARALWAETPLEDIENEADLATGFAELVNEIVPAVMLEPKVIGEGEPEEGEILLEWIEFPDKVFIFNLAIQPVEVMRKFRDEQIANVDSVSDGEESGDETE